MYDIPQIKIEVDSMRYQIVHAFAQHNDEIEKIVEEELNKAIENFDFSGQIKNLSQQIISDAVRVSVENYFKYGDGFTAIDQEVKKVFSKYPKNK